MVETKDNTMVKPEGSVSSVERLCHCLCTEERAVCVLSSTVTDRSPNLQGLRHKVNSCCQLSKLPQASRNKLLHPFSGVCLSYTVLAVTVCILCLSIPCMEASTVPRRTSKTIQQTAVDFLSKYGYISGPTQELDDLRAPEDFSDAIRRFQRFAEIPETGTVDHNTLALMSKPRCGNKDFVTRRGMFSRRRKRFTKAPSKWKKDRLTFRILNYSPDLPISVTRTAIYNALYVWQRKTTLEFEERISGKADIMILFANRYHQDGYPFDGEGRVLAHAFFPGEDRGGDTHFDDDEKWTINSNEGIDLFMVAAHEFGHALGLAHSNVKGALMYPWYQGYKENFQLPYDDILGIQTLYGPRREKPNERPTPPLPEIPSRPPNEGTTDTPTGTPRSIDPEGSIPNPCTMSYDAIAVIRQEVYIFRQRWFWRLSADGIIQGSPVQIHQFWHDLPTTIDHIDALYESPDDGKIIFFIGDRYWKFEANRLVNGFPKQGRPITEFGIPHDVKKIDAVFVWSYNKKTYLISNDMYWKLDKNNVAEYDYPRDMSTWAGVRIPVNAAFQYWDGRTYFFHDQYYWEFNDVNMAVLHSHPKKSSTKFMRCENSESNSAEPIYSSSIESSGQRSQGEMKTMALVVVLALSLFLHLRHV